MIELLDSHKNNLKIFVELERSFSNIKFFDKNHHYEIDGEPALMSVSQLISKYEKPFEKNKMAERIAKREGVLIEDIIKRWDWNKEYSCHKGSEFHLIVENFFQRKVIPINKKAFIQFLNENQIENKEKYINNYYEEMAIFIRNFKNFYDWWKNDHVLIKSEFVIGDKQTRICGTIDNLSFNVKTNSFAIFDYKTNKEIKKEGYQSETLLEPLNDVQKCELGKYSLQLNLYKEIFERNTPFKVDKSYIVWVADKNNYELIETLDLTKQANKILEIQKKI
jgi:hypothetical protein